MKLPAPQPGYTPLRRAFLSGEDSPSRYLDRCLERLAAVEREVRAFVVTDVAQARRLAEDATHRYRSGQALSPIDGIPIGVKDIIETRDFPTQMGSEVFAGWQSRRDAWSVHALRSAGAIVVGKTATTEFAVGRAAPTRNPHDLQRTPAGSSSGSAAAVAAGMVPLALGTQTQSSTLRPASFCGVLGYKPTFDRFDMRGVHPLAPSHDHLGLLASSLDDVWAVACLLAGAPDETPPPRRAARLAFVRTAGWQPVAAPVKDAFLAWLARLADGGSEVRSASDDRALAALDAALADADEVSEDILAYEMHWPFASYAEAFPALLGERVRELIARGVAVGDRRYRERVARRETLRAHVRELTPGYDAFVTLAASGVASLGLENTGARSFPIPWSLVGGPSMSLPLLAHDGLPLGVQIMAAPGTDRSLFAVARWLLDRARAAAVSPALNEEASP